MSRTQLATITADRLADHLGDLVGSGLPLAQGLAAIATETPDERTRLVFKRLAARLDAGATIGQALADDRVRVSPHLRALIGAGIRSGRLPEILAQVATEAGFGRQLRARFWLSLTYPAFLLCFAACLFGLLSAVPIAALGEVLNDFGVNIPVVTRHLLVVANALAGMGGWVVGRPVIVVAVGGLLVRILFSPAERRSLLMGLPLVGPLYRATALADFFRILSWLMDADLPLTDAIPMAAQGTGDPAIGTASAQVSAGIEQGLSLATALEREPLFPSGLGVFLDWADGTRSPGQALRLAAALFELRSEAQGRFAAVMLSVLAVGLLVAWLLLMVFALLLPTMHLLGKLSG